MTYKPAWRGRARVLDDGRIFWDGEVVARYTRRSQEGARSPGGMVTNTVWVCGGVEYAALTQLLEAVLPKETP